MSFIVTIYLTLSLHFLSFSLSFIYLIFFFFVFLPSSAMGYEAPQNHPVSFHKGRHKRCMSSDLELDESCTVEPLLSVTSFTSINSH